MLLSSLPLPAIVRVVQLAWLSPTSIAVGSDGINRNFSLAKLIIFEIVGGDFARPISDLKAATPLLRSSYLFPLLEIDPSFRGKRLSRTEAAI